MAVVTGRLSDLGWHSMTPYRPKILFVPQSVQGSARLYGSRLLPSRGEEAVITGTSWSVDLVPTVGMVPTSWYEIHLIYLDAEGNFARLDVLPLRIRVPGAGGDIGDLPDIPFSPEHVWVSLDPPPVGFSGWWLHSGPGDPDDVAQSGTGELRAWRTV